MGTRISRKGVKNFQGRDFGLFQLRSILANIYDQATKAGERAAGETIEDIGRRFLEYIASHDPEFNDYTGNLSNSYAAKIFIKGKYLKTLFHHTGYTGRIYTTHGKRGGRYALLRKPPRHGVSGPLYATSSTGERYKASSFAKNVKPSAQKRYLKRWEKRSYRNWNRSYDRNMLMRDKKGRFISQAWIEIENQAPYAEMVQQARGASHRHYSVLHGARVEKLKNGATMLVKRATMANLRKAGFKIKG